MNLYQKIFLSRLFPDSEIANELSSSNRYKSILLKSGELWVGEYNQRNEIKKKFNNWKDINNVKEIPPCPRSPISFDWMAQLPKIPIYAHPLIPKCSNIAYSYCDVDFKLATSYNCRRELNDLNMKFGSIPTYSVYYDNNNYPVNPLVFNNQSLCIKGRGVLGNWGPNHTGDALITQRNPKSGKLQILLIQRDDGSKKFAFPGGFVDPHESSLPIKTVLRELLEETIGRQGYNNSFTTLKNIFGEFEWSPVTGNLSINGRLKFSTPIYCGIVLDERNTDNAWIETTAFHWHLNSCDAVNLSFQSGDDAIIGTAGFYDIEDDKTLLQHQVQALSNLFASHSQILRTLLEKKFPEFFSTW